MMNFKFENDVHFSSTEHQKADWLGIHEKICQLLIALRTPIPFLGSEEERQHRKQQQIVRQVCDYQKGILVCQQSYLKFNMFNKYFL